MSPIAISGHMPFVSEGQSPSPQLSSSPKSPKSPKHLKSPSSSPPKNSTGLGKKLQLLLCLGPGKNGTSAFCDANDRSSPASSLVPPLQEGPSTPGRRSRTTTLSSRDSSVLFSIEEETEDVCEEKVRRWDWLGGPCPSPCRFKSSHLPTAPVCRHLCQHTGTGCIQWISVKINWRLISYKRSITRVAWNIHSSQVTMTFWHPCWPWPGAVNAIVVSRSNCSLMTLRHVIARPVYASSLLDSQPSYQSSFCLSHLLIFLIS